MKAIVFSEHGGPEVLQYKEVADPEIREDEVLVRVRACALNYLDIGMRKGSSHLPVPLPHIPGSDISGEVATMGMELPGMKVGQKVIIAPGLSCRQCDTCLAGFDNLCESYRFIGYLVDGGCAEYVRVPAVNVMPMPECLSFEEAAAIPCVFLTVWHMLQTRAALKPGEKVLVQGVGSGVGSAAVQVAKLSGAHVIATSSSDDKLAKAKMLGADEVINYRQQDIAERVSELTNGRGVEVVFEHVGAATWEKSLASLAPTGRLVTCGATTGASVKVDLSSLIVRQWSLLGSYIGTRGELETVLELVRQGKLRPVVDRVFPLAEAAKAHAYLEKQQHFGKVVLQV